MNSSGKMRINSRGDRYLTLGAGLARWQWRVDFRQAARRILPQRSILISSSAMSPQSI